MHIFVTGATGNIGSAVVSELINAGHHVIGLARSGSGAMMLKKAGAEVHFGDLENLDSLRSVATAADGIIQLAFSRDLSQIETAARVELCAIELFGDILAGSGRPLVIASGGPEGSESDPLPTFSPNPRLASAKLTLALANRDVRSAIVRVSPTVHDRSRCDMVAQLAAIARIKGVSGYIGDGSNRWPSVHRLDIASLFRLAVEKAPKGSILHAVSEEGVPFRAIAEIIGHQLGIPVAPIAPEDAMAHFGFLAHFIGLDMPALSTLTRELVGWQPTHPTLIEDLKHGLYFKN